MRVKETFLSPPTRWNKGGSELGDAVFKVPAGLRLSPGVPDQVTDPRSSRAEPKLLSCVHRYTPSFIPKPRQKGEREAPAFRKGAA